MLHDGTIILVLSDCIPLSAFNQESITVEPIGTEPYTRVWHISVKDKKAVSKILPNFIELIKLKRPIGDIRICDGTLKEENIHLQSYLKQIESYKNQLLELIKVAPNIEGPFIACIKLLMKECIYKIANMADCKSELAEIESINSKLIANTKYDSAMLMGLTKFAHNAFELNTIPLQDMKAKSQEVNDAVNSIL